MSGLCGTVRNNLARRTRPKDLKVKWDVADEKRMSASHRLFESGDLIDDGRGNAFTILSQLLKGYDLIKVHVAIDVLSH